MDYAALLLPAGIVLRKKGEEDAWWGTPEMVSSDKGVELTSETLQGTPLYEAGLERGDNILEIDGKKVNAKTEVKSLLAARKPGQTVRVKVRTRAGEHEVGIRLAQDPQLELVTFEQAGKNITPAIEIFRKAWLGSKALHPLPDIN